MQQGGSKAGSVRVGIGGWVYEPWRGHFYPPGLAQARELQHASRQVTSIEINSTYYRAPAAATYASWRDQTPEGFVFSLKAPRHITQRRALADTGESVRRFLNEGPLELGTRLGPVVWQFAPTKAFDPQDFAGFLALLPREHALGRWRHVLEVRHASFMTPEFLALARAHGCATVFTDSPKHPSFADLTADDLVYARLMRSQAAVQNGYPEEALGRWKERAQAWARGAEPEDLPRVNPPSAPTSAPRDVFIFFIDGDKEKAPFAATALLGLLQG